MLEDIYNDTFVDTASGSCSLCDADGEVLFSIQAE